MQTILLDAFIDSLKVFPFLFFTFLVMEYLEHKMTKKSDEIIRKSGRYGPLLGAILGVFPQCGFSIVATNFYTVRVITLGTLISVYLATSDEMLPILISQHTSIQFILCILFMKFFIGVLFGFLIDFLFRKKSETNIEIHQICKDEHCGCEHGIFLSTLKHTIHIFIFLFIVTSILNLGFSYFGEERLSRLFMKNSLFGPLLSSLIGLIPNCGSSILLTELYLNHTISFASLLAGLLTGSGVALLVLFKSNKNLKENLLILSIIYLIGVFVGFCLQLYSFL